MSKTLWPGFVLVAIFGISWQVQAFDQPVTVADVRTHLSYYEGNSVSMEGFVQNVRSETQYITDWDNRMEFPITIYHFELTDDSGTMTVKSRMAPETGLVKVRAQIVRGAVVVYEMQRVRPPCVTASC